MAANRTTQLKRRSQGCLKGGASAEAAVASLATLEADVPMAPDVAAVMAPRYALSLGSGLKIRLTMRREVDTDKKEEAESVESLEPMLGMEEAIAEPLVLESDGEELLEEEGEDDGDCDDDDDAVDSSKSTLQQQSPAPAPLRSTVEIVCRVDQLHQPVVLVGSIDIGGLPVKRLTPIATVPLSVASATETPLATIRGLGLAGLVERLHDRRIGLLAEASYGEGEDEVDGPVRQADRDSPSQLLLLPAARLPWASLTVHRLPAAPDSAGGSAVAAAPPDWWGGSDGPDSDINLNSLRRSDIFKQQFGD